MYLYQAAPPAHALLATPDNTAKLRRTPRAIPTTLVATEASAHCCHLRNTPATVPEDGQDHGVSMRTAACLIPVQMVEHAALCQEAASHAPVLLATQVFTALMTRMNVPPHPLYVRMKGFVSTPPALTNVFVPLDLLENIVKAPTSLALLHRA